jgi:DNA-directed RNA polymerase sigma subunit (sigma70/sigma32)
MTTIYSTGGNITVVSIDAIDGADTIVDSAPPVEHMVHAQIRASAVDEIIGAMEGEDSVLAEVLIRSLGLGDWAAESIAAIGQSIDETPYRVRQLLAAGLREFEIRARSHRNRAYLETGV